LWDNPAWREFFALYDPLVRAYCSVYRLDSASLDELCQRVWVDLARRMPSYQYDPGGSFRGWLRRLCHHRAIDFYRERRDHLAWPLGDPDQIEDQRAIGGRVDREGGDEEPAPDRLLLLREAKQAQEEVRRKVKPMRWEVFWRVVIEGESMSAAASALGLKYSTAYASVNHVSDLLRAEGERRGARFGLNNPSNHETN
jgi:RNA polymerase sigma-70 factor (ECF subfamily)